jgi:membrane-associated phospholipid phosphatase
VLLNAHFLSDVLGGGLLGWWAGQLGLWLAERFAPIPARLAGLRATVETGRGAGASSA